VTLSPGNHDGREAGSVVPDQRSEEEHRRADEPGRAVLLLLGAGERQPVVHMTLAVQDGLRRGTPPPVRGFSTQRRGTTVL